MEFYDILGTAGVGFIVVMYIMLQTGRIDPGRMAFSLFNAVGSVLILISLGYEFNFSAVLIEGIWLLVSLYGLWRAWQKRRTPG
jgi:paired small multidrug resistance pump